jgi:hypothetical protein
MMLPPLCYRGEVLGKGGFADEVHEVLLGNNGSSADYTPSRSKVLTLRQLGLDAI